MQNFNSIYSENYKSVFNFLNFKLNNTSIGEELTNDVFMKVYKNLDIYDENLSQMSTWVMNITKNTMIDYLRKKKLNTITLEKEIDGKIVSFVDNFLSPNNPYTTMVSNEKMIRINMEIQSLKPKYKRVAELFFNKELNYEEISKKLNLPLGTVKGQINRLRTSLQTKLPNVEY